MARPFKHPKTGIFWFRKAVPEELRSLVGKREELLSLDTRDPEEAKTRFARTLLDVTNRWSSLRAGPREISEREAHELAVPIFDNWLEGHRENPSEEYLWHSDLFSQLWTAELASLRSEADDLDDRDASREELDTPDMSPTGAGDDNEMREGEVDRLSGPDDLHLQPNVTDSVQPPTYRQVSLDDLFIREMRQTCLRHADYKLDMLGWKDAWC